MDRERVSLLQELLSSTGWVDRSRGFARSLRRQTDGGDQLLLVGTPTQEPWHLAAHLDDESRYANLPRLSPTLVRWSPPPGAPSHLSVGIDRLQQATRGQTLFVVAPDDPTEDMLERLSDARRHGATLLALDAGDSELGALAHDQLIVPARGLIAPGEHSGLSVQATAAGLNDLDLSMSSVSFEAVQHLVSAAAGAEDLATNGTSSFRRRGLRDRLGRALDAIAGPSTSRDW